MWFLMPHTIALALRLDVSKARGEMSSHMWKNGMIPSIKAIKAIKAVVVRYVGSAGQLGA
jgi:hypothetical protein